MLIIHQDTMYDAEISIQELDGKYALKDSEGAILFSSNKIADTNKALQFVTEQDSMGNGILVDQIAPNVYATAVVLNEDLYEKHKEKIAKKLKEKGICTIFVPESESKDIEKIRLLEEENENNYFRDIDNRIAVGFSPDKIPENYREETYDELVSLFNLEIILDELDDKKANKETTTEDPQQNNAVEIPQTENKKKYLIETRDETFSTDAINISKKPTKSGFYYINDENGKGFFRSKDKEVLEHLISQIEKMTEKGEIVSVNQLKKLERLFLKEKNKLQNEVNIKEEYKSLLESAKKIEDLEIALNKEKENVQKQIAALKKNNAPEEVIKNAKELTDAKEKEIKAAKDMPESETKNEVTRKALENAYSTYHLQNSLLTRINSALKAGAMNLYLTFMEPMRALGDLSMTMEVKNLAEDTLKLQHKLNKYQNKVTEKMEKRVERENRNRIRSGKDPLPNGATLYTTQELQKINEYKLSIEAIKRRSDLLQVEIIKTRQEHQERLEYVKTHKAIANNEKIVTNYKELTQPENIKQESEKPNDIKTQPTNDDISVSEQSSDVISKPQNTPDDYYSQMSDYAAYCEEQEQVVPPVQEPTFAPLEARFTAAKEEAAKEKIERDAKFAYHALSTRLPINGYIEFTVNENSYAASKNEVGEFEFKKYSFETGRNEKMSVKNTIEEFKTNPKAYENAIREQLGNVLINKEKGLDM